MDMEFWNEHIITHKVVMRYNGKEYLEGVGSLNMCKRYVADNPQVKLIIKEL